MWLKKLLLPLAFLFILSTSVAQVINVPNKSEKHFQEKYPTAHNVNWSNNVTSYSVKFTMDGKKYRAAYHMDGTWDYTESPMEYAELPGEVKESVDKSKYADWKKLSSAYVENNRKQKMYRVEMKKGIEKKYVYYDHTGKELKTNTTL